MTGDSQAGKPFRDVFPHLATAPEVPTLTRIADVDWSGVDVAFCCLPHATTQEVLKGLPASVERIVDLSADFRLRDVDVYAEWYGGEHAAPALQREAAYGLTELHREAVRAARLVANPGCYPTCVQLALAPLLEAGLMSTELVVVDAKSGVSGAGRSAKTPNLFCEAADGMHAYGVGRHRHMPEIEQGLSDAAGAPVRVSFTPHLAPMSRGMLATCNVGLAPGAAADDLRARLSARYADEPFVHVLPAGQSPQTRHVRGSNHCAIGVFEDRIPGRAVVLSAIDNLVKGASGQAVQNMNLQCGWAETTGLEQLPMFP